MSHKTRQIQTALEAHYWKFRHRMSRAEFAERMKAAPALARSWAKTGLFRRAKGSGLRKILLLWSLDAARNFGDIAQATTIQEEPK